jgi:hypothetical protein
VANHRRRLALLERQKRTGAMGHLLGQLAIVQDGLQILSGGAAQSMLPGPSARHGTYSS